MFQEPLLRSTDAVARPFSAATGGARLDRPGRSVQEPVGSGYRRHAQPGGDEFRQRGAYHFAHPDVSTGAAQADYFLSHGGGWSGDGRTMPPALDLQPNPGGATCYGLTPAAMVSWISSFSAQLYAKTTKYPMLLTSYDWWNTCTGNSSAFAATNPFWLPSYGTATPSSIPAGTGTGTLWQSAASGTHPGGQDNFNGNYSRLAALATNHD